MGQDTFTTTLIGQVFFPCGRMEYDDEIMEYRSYLIINTKETLIKYHYRHAGENQHPVTNVPPSYLPPGRGKGIPAFAGMTNYQKMILIQRFP